MKFLRTNDDAVGSRQRRHNTLERLGQWLSPNKAQANGGQQPAVVGSMQQQQAAAVALGADLFERPQAAGGKKVELKPAPNLDLYLLHVARQRGLVASPRRTGSAPMQPVGVIGRSVDPSTGAP